MRDLALSDDDVAVFLVGSVSVLSIPSRVWERTSSAAIVAVAVVLITGRTLMRSWLISVKEANRKMADGSDPRNRKAPLRKRFPMLARFQLNPWQRRQLPLRSTRLGHLKLTLCAFFRMAASQWTKKARIHSLRSFGIPCDSRH